MVEYSGRASSGTHQNIQWSSLSDIQSNLTQAQTQLNSQINELDAQLRSSLALWTGSAQQAYYAAHTKWKTSAEDIANIMGTIARAVDTARANYQKAETANYNSYT
jgi:WXG100 family type VII secretion target